MRQVGASHNWFLNSMVTSTTGNPFQLLNSYELYHLPAHLEWAKRADDLHLLLFAPTTDHRNAWYELKESVIGTEEYLADIGRAWSLARQSSQNLGLESSYALIVSSMGSLTGNVPTEMVTTLVQQGIWPVQKALAMADRTRTSNGRRRF